MSRSLTGTTVIVTGGARGIGRATAERLARQGAQVALGDFDPDHVAEVAAEIARATGATVVGARLDVTDRRSWAEFLTAIDQLGPIDVLVNNAGIMPLGPLIEEPDDVTDAIIDVNLRGVITGSKALAQSMVARGSGHIINVASAVGRVALSHGATYSASKFAVVGFSEALRAELAPAGVAVSMVLPTVVRTELAAGVPAARGVKAVQPEDVAAVIEHAIRKPTPELWVPRWTQGLTKTTLAFPRAVQDALSHALKADAVLSETDADARKAYEDRARHGVACDRQV